MKIIIEIKATHKKIEIPKIPNSKCITLLINQILKRIMFVIILCIAAVEMQGSIGEI